jgi:hypothetical protein
MSARAGAVLALFLVATSCADAAPVSIPRNELAGRERERFIDPFPPPRAGAGPVINMWDDRPPARNRAKGKKRRR